MRELWNDCVNCVNCVKMCALFWEIGRETLYSI